MRQTLKIQMEIHVDGSPTKRARIRVFSREIERALAAYAKLLCDAHEGATLYDFTPEQITDSPRADNTEGA